MLFVILALGIYLSSRPTTLSSDASGSCEPTNPQITNLTYSSFDFSFTTSSSCLATLSLDGKIFTDSSTVLNTHYFKVTNLSPQTSYKFGLISGNVNYSRPEFQLTTTLKPTSPIPSSNLAWGKIIDSSGKAVPGAIVYLTIPGSQALSAFSNKDGHWNISFATSFNEGKNDWFSPSANADEDLIVYSPDGQLTQLTNNTNRNDPVPDITIGQNYFSVDQASGTNSTGISADSSTNTTNISILSPQEGETISSLRPDIFGNGPSGETMQIILDGSSDTITPLANNVWHWSPATNLADGSHRLTLSYQSKLITRNFIVRSGDDTLSFTATPSATLAPLNPTLTLTPTLVPTTTILPTEVPTSTPVVRTSHVSTTSSMPTTGNALPTLILGLFSFIFFSVSLYYYRQ